jgi:hypothetical protein
VKEKWMANPKEGESAQEYKQQHFVEHRPSGAWLTSCGSSRSSKKILKGFHLSFPCTHCRTRDVLGTLRSSTGVVYNNFLRYVLPELSQYVDLQTGIHLSSVRDGDPSRFVLSVRELFNNVFSR